MVEVLLERGELDEAREVLAGAPLDEQRAGHVLFYLCSRGRLHLEAGEPGKALPDFELVGEIGGSLEPLPALNPAVVPWRSRAALALHFLARSDEARTLAREELERAQRWGAARTIGVSLRALGLVEGGQRGHHLLREAAEMLAGSPAPLEHAKALVDLGAALRRDNQRAKARRLLREAVELAHGCGAVPLVERANDELAATGAHRRTIVLSGLDALTASERRVAQLAADDLSNKEIAQALFVTVKTVEVHLSRVYRKLDIGSRRQLAAALAEPAAATA